MPKLTNYGLTPFVGQLAKTDQLDAGVLRAFGERMRPSRVQPPEPVRERLADLVLRREQLVTLLSTEEQRLTQSRDKTVRKLSQKLIRELEKQIVTLEKAIAGVIDDDDTLRQQCERLQEVKGIGQVTASTLLATLPELGQLIALRRDGSAKPTGSVKGIVSRQMSREVQVPKAGDHKRMFS